MKTNKNVGFTMKIISTTIIFIGTAGCAAFTDQLKPLPPTELLWNKPGHSRIDVDSELIKCSHQLKSQTNLTFLQMSDIVDTCMLKKGFSFTPHPNGWANFCYSNIFSETLGCKSAQGKIHISPDETSLQTTISNKKEKSQEAIDCRKSSPYYEKAYCECQSGRRYSVNDPCEYLLKNKGNN